MVVWIVILAAVWYVNPQEIRHLLDQRMLILTDY